MMGGEGCCAGVWLNQKQYIIKGMTHGMGLHLVLCKSEKGQMSNFKQKQTSKCILEEVKLEKLYYFQH